MGEGVTADNDYGLFATTPTGSVITIAREGDLFSNSQNSIGTLTLIQFVNDENAVRNVGGGLPSGLSSNGDIVFAGYFSGSNRAIIKRSTTSAIVDVESIDALVGLVTQGDVPELSSSDDQDFSMIRNSASIDSRTGFELESTSPISSPTSISVTLEGSVFARSRIVQSVELFNFQIQDWVVIDSRDASFVTDQVVTVSVPGVPADYVEAVTNRMKARIQYSSPIARQQFLANTDQFKWEIFY